MITAQGAVLLKAAFKRRHPDQPLPVVRLARWLWQKLQARAKRNAPQALERWPLHQPLMAWSKRDTHTIGAAVTGVFDCGRTGSGKTAFVGYDLGCAYLKGGFGALVLCVKDDEAMWIDMAKRTGREADLLIFGHPDRGSKLRFNFLGWEASRPGVGAGITENIVRLLSEISEIAARRLVSQTSTGSDPFWKDSVDTLVRNTVELCLLADVSPSADLLQQIVLSAPTSREEMRSEAWRGRSLCWAMLKKAASRPLTKRQERDLEVVSDYFLNVLAGLADRTRSVILSSFTTLTDTLGRNVLHELFGGETNVTPEMLGEGKIIVVSLPVLHYGVHALIANAVWKLTAQRWLQTRDVAANPRPVAIWCDEAQYLVTKGDALFASTCRSSRAALVYMTQTIGGLHTALGGGDAGKAETDALLANLATKLFLCNSDPVTNEYAAGLIGKSRKLFRNASNSYQPGGTLERIAGMMSEPTVTAGFSEQNDWTVAPERFLTLRTGDKASGGVVDAILIRSGQVLQSSGAVFLPVTFRRTF